jgi:UDP-4-amino-4,6-dideoxy-N-acetyl-beta-L-altrosamine transaminase
MISYGKQSISKTDIDAVIEVLKGDWLTQGLAVDKFENDLKNYFGAKHVCAVSNGTAALHLVGLALGWKPGDIILTSPITFLATANCIVYSGATPDFVDIEPVTYTIDPNRVEEKIKHYQSKGKKVKAIIGVDYAGHPCNWQALRELADKYGVQLVNDNCHALGSAYLDDKQYAVKYADLVTQSYHPVKHITTGEGGAIFTNDSSLDEEIKKLRSHGMTKDSNLLEKNDGLWYYEMHRVGYNYRITDFQCALGSSQLKRLNSFVQMRQMIAQKYDKWFSESDIFKVPKVHESIEHSYHLYPLQIDFEKTKIGKLEFFQKMKKSNINLQVHYIPVHLQPYYQKKYSYQSEELLISETFYKNEVSLPVYPELNHKNQQYVKEMLFKYLGEK